MNWPQNYDPMGGMLGSAAVAALPVVTLLGLLAWLNVRAHLAALAGLLVALATSVWVYGMPAKLAGLAALNGALFGLFPIGWIILNAMFVYDLSVATGQFGVLQRQVAGVSGDRRIQALLIAFGFGAFVEGAAGFGAPVAITGALLMGLGFRPMEAAKLALIGNTAPVAYGALGTPLLTLARVTDMDVQALSAMVGRQLPWFSLLVPFWLVAVQSGWRGLKGAWPACLVTGGSFAVLQFVVSNFHGPWLVDIVGAAGSMGALVLFMKVWKPADVESAGGKQDDRQDGTGNADANATDGGGAATGPAWKAWVPWLALTAAVFVWGLPVVKARLNGWWAPEWEIAGLHRAVVRMPPVVKVAEPEKAVFVFNALSATGTALLLAGIGAGAALGVGAAGMARLYLGTLGRLRESLVTIGLMLALGFVTRYSGTDTTMGLAMAGTGFLFPFFSPLIGWLGVALTGSDTSSNVLFGNLQQVTAGQLGLSPVLMAASNSSGGVMGKMIDAQSLVVASAATGGHPGSPDAGSVLRAVFWHSLALALLMGGLVMAQAYVVRGMVPGW